MIPNALQQDFEALPPEAKQQVIDFVAFMKARYSGEGINKDSIENHKLRQDERSAYALGEDLFGTAKLAGEMLGFLKGINTDFEREADRKL